MKLSSKVNEITTQYKLNKKYPNPKYHPYLKKDLLLDNFLFFRMRNIKNNEKVIKLIIKKLYGGKLKELIAPKEIMYIELKIFFLNKFSNL